MELDVKLLYEEVCNWKVM